jgi:hypothetical protein
MGAVVVQPLPYCARYLGLVQLRGDGRTQGALARLNQALPFVCTRSPQTILRDTSGGGWHPRAELGRAIYTAHIHCPTALPHAFTVIFTVVKYLPIDVSRVNYSII